MRNLKVVVKLLTPTAVFALSSLLVLVAGATWMACPDNLKSSLALVFFIILWLSVLRVLILIIDVAMALTARKTEEEDR